MSAVFRTGAATAKEAPKVSFIVLAHNQQAYIRDAVEAAFSQTYSPMEIILSDDCSTDSTFEIMGKLAQDYTGPHRIILNRNSENLGLGRHYNKVMEIASGEIIELAAGDDISLSWRTSDSVSLLQRHAQATCVALEIHRFEADPPKVTTPGALERVAHWNLEDFTDRRGFFVNAPGRAFWKSTHDFFGPLSEDCPVEDGPVLLRCLLHGEVVTSEKIGVLYRWNGRNISSPENLQKITFANIYDDYLRTVEIALKTNLIDQTTGNGLREKFGKLRNRAALLEVQKKSPRQLAAALPIVKSSDFTIVERLRLLAKWTLRSLRLYRERVGAR